jgi:hypothetical protein
MQHRIRTLSKTHCEAGCCRGRQCGAKPDPRPQPHSFPCSHPPLPRCSGAYDGSYGRMRAYRFYKAGRDKGRPFVSTFNSIDPGRLMPRREAARFCTSPFEQRYPPIGFLLEDLKRTAQRSETRDRTAAFSKDFIGSMSGWNGEL